MSRSGFGSFPFWTKTITASFCHSVGCDPQRLLHQPGSRRERYGDTADPQGNFDEQIAENIN